MQLVFALVLLVASYLITSLTMKTPQAKAATLADWDIPQSEEGTEQAVIFGDVWLKGPFILWYGNYRTVKIRSKGKK